MENFPRKQTGKQKFYLVLAVVGVLTISTVGYLTWKSTRFQKESVPTAMKISTVLAGKGDLPLGDQSATPEVTASIETSTTSNDQMIPPELNLDVPFFTQAPFANWDYPWQEACEEASVLLIANSYFEHDWDKTTFNKQILDMVEWEKKRFGDYKHTTVDQTVSMLDEYLGLKSVIHENPNYEDVQKILAGGHLIVMTFDGKTLGNPNYKNGGPVYHAMVIKGYKAGQKIITNDVGTRNGADYVYAWSTIQNSLHDYSEPMKNGAKRIIEILPPTAVQSAGTESEAA